MMCFQRDKRGRRCEVTGPHQEIINSKGQQAVVHTTATSLWSIPVVSEFVCDGTSQWIVKNHNEWFYVGACPGNQDGHHS